MSINTQLSLSRELIQANRQEQVELRRDPRIIAIASEIIRIVGVQGREYLHTTNNFNEHIAVEYHVINYNQSLLENQINIDLELEYDDKPGLGRFSINYKRKSRENLDLTFDE